MAGEALGEGSDALVGRFESGFADEAGILVLFEEAHLLLMLAIEGVDPFAALDEGLLRVHIRGEAINDACHLEGIDALVERPNNRLLAGKVVIDKASASVGALCNYGHRGLVETTFYNDVEHRIKDGVALIRLCFGCHIPIVPWQERYSLQFGDPYRGSLGWVRSPYGQALENFPLRRS